MKELTLWSAFIAMSYVVLKFIFHFAEGMKHHTTVTGFMVGIVVMLFCMWNFKDKNCKIPV